MFTGAADAVGRDPLGTQCSGPSSQQKRLQRGPVHQLLRQRPRARSPDESSGLGFSIDGAKGISLFTKLDYVHRARRSPLWTKSYNQHSWTFGGGGTAVSRFVPHQEAVGPRDGKTLDPNVGSLDNFVQEVIPFFLPSFLRSFFHSFSPFYRRNCSMWIFLG